MIEISTERLRGMVMWRRVRCGSVVYEYDRGETTTRTLKRVSDSI